MKALSNQLMQKSTLISIFIDMGALVFIYLVPTISHLLNLPVFLIEPMRLMLIFALVHTSKKNAYILALSMPLFSFLISSHPLFPKMILISFELSLNVFLFYLLVKKINFPFLSILISIIISKTTYYIIKFCLINLAFINTELFSTPIIIQLITTFLFSLYVFKFFNKKVT